MARLFLPAERLASDEVLVAGQDYRYLCRVLRLGPGDEIVLFDGQGHEARARLEAVGPRQATLRVLGRQAAGPRRGAALVLLVALAKGDKMDLVVQKATELGCVRIVPALSARSVPRAEASRLAARRSRWEAIARAAARQSGRADVPQLAPLAPFGEALRQQSPEALRLLFWEGAREASLRAALPAGPVAEVVAAIGPEGGLGEAEVAEARALGYAVVGLGPRTLRAETAALVALAVLGYALGDLG